MKNNLKKIIYILVLVALTAFASYYLCAVVGNDVYARSDRV